MSSAVVARRKRSFGGRAGTWLRKRKAQEELASTGSNLLLARNTGLVGASLLSGWDDVRCRPVYQTTLTIRHVSTSTQESTTNDLTPQTPLGKVTKEEETKPVEKKVPIKRTRSYGGARKQRKLVDGEKFQDSFAFESYTTNPTTLPDAEADRDLDFRISAADGRKSNARRVSIGTFSRSKMAVFEFNDDNHKKGSEPANETLRDDTPSSETCKTPKGPPQTVSFTTSLSVAKEFYRKLDNEHALTIAAEPSTSPRYKRKQTWRSSRRMSSPTSRQLTQEYCDYTDACKASSVTPIAKESFASNRGSFRPSNEFYDGCLDE